MAESSKRLSTNIRMRLALAVIFISGLTVVVALLGYWGMRQLQSRAESTLEGAAWIQQLSQELEKEFLLARQAESTFLNNWRTIGYDQAAEDYLANNQQHLATTTSTLNLLQMLSRGTGSELMTNIDETVGQLRPLITEYESVLADTEHNVEQLSSAQGFDQLSRQQIETLLDQAADLDPSTDTYSMLLLQMVANEQAYMNTLDQQYLDDVYSDALALKGSVTNSTIADQAVEDFLAAVDQHLAAFDELARLEQDIAANLAAIVSISAEVNALNQDIVRFSQLALADLRQEFNETFQRSAIGLVVGTIVVLVIGQLVIGPIMQRIQTVLGQFTDVARELSAGKLDQQIPVSGNDEFARLGQTFNQMSAQLHDLISNLEQRVEDRTKALETSVLVSRSLSTVLDPKSLIVEVVEQIQGVFNYYHAQIYLLDDSASTLNLAAATGQVGREMLEQGHKLAHGQGLVGRAAATNSAVLIANVAENPNWFPNPLLPDTQCEAAVPIAIGDQVVGVLDVQDNQVGRLQPADVDLLQSIASQVALALQNAHLFSETRIRAEKEAALNAVNQRIQSATTIDDVLQIAALELGQITNTRRVAVELSLGDRLRGGNGQSLSKG